MKVKWTEKITKKRIIDDICCKKMEEHINPSRYEPNVTCEDGKIAFCGWYINYCPFCGKKIE